MKVTLQGEPIECEGTLPKIGDEAPQFALKDAGGNTIQLSDFKGRVLVISTYPDIETSVCSIQSETFNDYAREEGDRYHIISVSTNDQSVLEEWGEEHEAVMPLYHDAVQFGKDYGIYLSTMDKLARAVFVIDPSGVVRYVELVNEVTDEPNYKAAIEAAEKLK